jgi:hypothetical protein
VADEILTYAAVWAGYEGMEDAHKESVRVQILNIVKDGVPLAGVTELVFGAPVEFKEQAWKLWAANADVSGYHLKDILALGVTETVECVYPIVSKWARTAKLGKCSVKDLLKIGESLTDYNDFVSVWRNWSKTADLRKYKLMEVAEVMNRTNDPVAAFAIGSRWIEQVEARGVRELKHLTQKEREKINDYCLPQPVIELWNKALKA